MHCICREQEKDPAFVFCSLQAQYLPMVIYTPSTKTNTVTVIVYGTFNKTDQKLLH